MSNQLDPRLELYARVVSELHKRFKPHEGQIKIGRALFSGFKDIFVEAGRNFGKTSIIQYLLWRWAMLHPGSENYYFAPYMKQAREIIWAPRLLQNFGPRDWILHENNTEMRIPFKNGSFIKADGSDNVDAYRGVKPKGLIVFDEFKDFREEFYEAFDPNRAAFGAPLIIIGTPPERECQFTRVRDAYKSDPKKAYFHGPTSENPHISKEWLEEKRLELINRGDENIWQREYLALQVSGGASKIFPMISIEKHVVTHNQILQDIRKDRKRMDWIWFADPAAASTFGVLYLCHNPYTKQVYVMGELYEKQQAEMTVAVMGRKIIDLRNQIDEVAEWRQGYDEAATWFQNEMLDNFGEHLEPSQKAKNDKESGITLIKDMLLQGKLIISDACPNLFWELDNYFKDKGGNIPKVNDHLIDCLRYALHALYYSLPQVAPPEDIRNIRRTRMEDDFYKGSEFL